MAFNGAVGSGVRLGAISFTSAGSVTFDDSVTAASLVAAGGAAVTTAIFNGAQNYNAAAGLNFVADSITLSAGITTTAAGVVTLNADTGSLTISAAGDISSNGVVTLTGFGGIITSGDITGTAAAATITFASPTTMNAGIALNTAGGAINFDSTLNGNQALSLNAGVGAVTFGGIVGGTQALANLDVTAGTINLNNNLTVDNQGGNTVTFTGATVLGANVTIDTDGAADNNVNFAGTVNADNAATQNRTLTVTAGTGAVTFGGVVGAGVNGALADLDVTAGTINLNAATFNVSDQGGNAATLTATTQMFLGLS